MAGQRVYELIWNEYCDWYIELVKKRLWSEDEDDKKIVRTVLVYLLKNMLKLLHPYMPFITEEIWSHLPHKRVEEVREGYLISAVWPKASECRNFPEEEAVLKIAMDSITAIRNIRAEANAAPSKKLTAIILTEGNSLDKMKVAESYIRDLANITEIIFISKQSEAPEDGMSAVIPGAQIFIPLEDLVDFEAELERLTKEKEKLIKEVERVEKKLSNKGFLAKAPEKVVAEEKGKMVKYREMLDKVLVQLDNVRKKAGK